MTRPQSEVERVLALHEAGLNKSEIARLTGLPRSSVRDWVADPTKTIARLEAPLRDAEPCADGMCPLVSRVDRSAYAYLLGQYLGDGSIATHPRTYRLRISCCAAYPGIIAEVAEAIRGVIGAKVGHVKAPGVIEVGAYSKHWPCLFPQHGPGRKHERPIVLADWQLEIVEALPERFLRGLIHSDGCRVKNVAVIHKQDEVKRYYYPRYHFSNASEDILGIFAAACSAVGVEARRANAREMTVNRREDVAKLDVFIGPKT